MKILVAEDEPILIRTIEMRLKRDGHEVLLAEDGQQALDKLEEGPPDLIITDIMMPYASGLEIIAAIRAKGWPKVPVIILSGMGQEDVGVVSAIIRDVARDRAVLMVEHNLSVVANICQHVTVLQRGEILAEGDYATVSQDERVRVAYMGTEEH